LLVFCALDHRFGWSAAPAAVGLGVLALLAPGLVWRILDVERVLKRDLPGYAAYTQKVRYRLVPYLW
jgi:protein-S-isoprenylcysteine O-methyltransferase Ste14